MTDSHTTRADYADLWRPARWGLLAAAIFVALLGGWSAFAPLAGAVIAAGEFQVEGRRQTVQHPYGGVISALMVSEGDQVTRGDVLIELSATEPQAEVDLLVNAEQQLLTQRARLVAERDGTAPDFPATAPAQTIANETALMQARAAEHAVNLDIADRRILQLQEQSAGLDRLIDSLARQTELLDEELTGARQLEASGNITRTRVIDLEREASALQAELDLKRADRLNIDERIGEAQLDIQRLERVRLSEISGTLGQIDGQIAELGPRLDAARDRLARTQILAPASGQVVSLAVFTEGGVIQPGAQLLDIVPGENPLVVQAQLRPADISDVALGAEVDVRLIGVPRDVRPTLGGVITSVSADTISDARRPEPHYALQITLDPAEVAAAGIDLQSGMPVQVVIETTPRTLLTYLVSPLSDELNGAFRER